MSIYALKPRFQAILRPLVGRLFALGVTANRVTLLAGAISVLLGLWLYGLDGPGAAFLLLPVWMLARMALNAVDGMLAREFGQQSALGAYLNELTDVISDAALYLPFALITPFTGVQIGLLIWLAALTELAGTLGPMVGASRRYDGPLGKSDRAFVFGALGLWVGLGWGLPAWAGWLLWAVAGLAAWTCVRRVRAGLAERGSGRSA